MPNKTRNIVISALNLLILTACSPQKWSSSSSGHLISEDLLAPQIISDRPIRQDTVFITLKLTHPALLEMDEFDSSDVARINQEQEAVIAELKKISADIKVIYRYRMILNGIAFSAPGELKKLINQIPGVRIAEPSRVISRPVVQKNRLATLSKKEGFKTTSVDFIEADRVHRELKNMEDQPIRGQNIHVGIIDTGIDFTHRMLGGSGRSDDFKNSDPSKASPAYPNQKVVGGIDLVGTDYDAGSELPTRQMPKPDGNPIDEGGHGTHVAGTVAGIGDGLNTYSGVAPDASLHAIKVFGANGSTSDHVVIAGLEYAADPNQDGDTADRLDVVNLSLGSGFGQPQILYTEAIRNLSRGGTVVVASAGNSGAIDYIVGAPSTADEALSVAASVDNMAHNWTFPAVLFQTPSQPELMVRAVEGPISKPLDETSARGPLVAVGLAAEPLPKEIADAVKGKIALIDRGGVPFLTKLKHAEAAGAIGAVVANNQPGDPIAMGGDGSVQIPAIMVTKEVGDTIKTELKKGQVSLVFNTGKKIEDPRLIDTITDFSSKGPRSMDSLLKPEITAPGENIISAAMGSGDQGVALSGTSMSGPHVAGVMALLKQNYPDLSTEQLKSLAMSTAKLIDDENDRMYPLTMQGAGRVRTFEAATAMVTTAPASLSLGQVEVGQSKTMRRKIAITNLQDHSVRIEFGAVSSEFLKIKAPLNVILQPRKSETVEVLVTVSAPKNNQVTNEMDGQLLLKVIGEGVTKEQRIPVLAISTKISQITASDLTIEAATDDDAVEAAAQFKLKNSGQQAGVALPFNLIGFDRRKPKAGVMDSYKSRSCDLESAGYRIVTETLSGEAKTMLQFAVKLYEPMTTWHYCEVSVQIDSDNDQLADQELVGISRGNLSGLGGGEFSSLLLDANVARQIRMKFEQELAKGNDPGLSYTPAILDLQSMWTFNHSTVAVIEVPLNLVAVRPNGELTVKVATLYADSEGLAPDDFLGGQLNKWTKLNSSAKSTGWFDMPNAIRLAPGQETTVSLAKGAGQEKLVIYMPSNRLSRDFKTDAQTQVLKATLSTPKLN